MKPPRSLSLPLAVLAILATITALSLAETFVAPLTLAFVAAMILSPINDAFRTIRVVPTLAALLTLVAAIAMVVALALVFRPWIAEVIDAWPKMRWEIRRTMVDLRASLGAVFDMQRDVMQAIDPEAAEGGAGETAEAMPSLSDAAWLAPYALAQVVLFLGGLFFFLVGKEGMYAVMSDRLKICPASAFDAAEERVARYFSTVALINGGFGAAVAVGLSLIGLPAAPLWGVIATLANFVLYLGPAVVAAALLMAGLVVFDGAESFLPAAIFVGLNAIEGQFVTPTLLGRQMRLSPLLVFVSLAFWLWLWGPVGGIVAIPLLLWGLEILREDHAWLAPESDPEEDPDAASISDTVASRPAGSNEAGANAR